MKFVADFHLHSKYSRAVSNKMNATELATAGKLKGLNLLGTGDLQHPLYHKELKEKLKDQGNGFYEHNGNNFVLSTEISLAFSWGGKGRRVHTVLLFPNFEVGDQYVEAVKKWGRVDYDGRPIFGKSCVELAEMCFGISKDIMIIPAHCWTPYFGIFGSKSGFNSLKDAFQEHTKDIYAIETGMSSDPAMNWRLSQLDSVVPVSFSDSHSPYPWRLGREATVFDLKEPSYKEMVEAIKKKDKQKMLFTIETDPGYGKYHFDGHAACGFSCSPEETKKHGGKCPKCGRPLTIGVATRIEELADRPEGFVPKGAIPFKTLLPLSEIIGGVMKSGVATKQVWKEFNALVGAYGNELNVLIDAPYENMKHITYGRIADAIMKNREAKIKVKPGYDGEYGVPIFEEHETMGAVEKKQRSLTEF